MDQESENLVLDPRFGPRPSTLDPQPSSSTLDQPEPIMRLLAILSLSIIASVLAAGEQAAKPNVVLILADDLGWTDLGCFGSDFYQSPHLDQLAREGMRFTANYSACTVCSPTRAALLTGKYPARLHVTDWIPGLPPENPKLIVPEFTKFLRHEETTIAELLHEAGYATASIGKWHLGDEAYYPDKHGFDLNVAGTEAPQPRPGYFAPYNIATLPQGPAGEYITDRLGSEAVRFIRAQVKAEQPFFLYLPHFAVHTPIQARPELVAKHKGRGREGNRHVNAAYAAMIDSLDQTVGRIRETLAELKVSDRTIIIFTSDNGGRVPTTSNAPLRVGKGSCYEGGVRVPLIVHWPNVTAANSTCDVPVITMDLFPTILEAVNLSTRPAVDGLSLVPLLRRTGSLPDRPLFWHYPHYQHYQQGGTTPYGAIRRGDHKLIEFYDDMRVELYNLRDDPGEQRDIAASEPGLANRLREQLHRWRGEVQAQMPTRNPTYDPTKPEHTPTPAKKKASP
jgi:arylsulfatase A-like enzyme